MSIISNILEQETGVSILCETYSATVDTSNTQVHRDYIKSQLENHGFSVTVENEDILSVQLVQKL